MFLKILDMSRTGSIVILAVMLARLLLKKAPKAFSYALWGVVLLRLLVPGTIQAPVSLVPEAEPLAASYTLERESVSIGGTVEALSNALNGDTGTQYIRTEAVDTEGNARFVTAAWWEVWVLAGQYVWLAGVAGMALYSVFSLLKLRRKLAVTILLRDNIYIADDISSPFVIGLFRPKIYLPNDLTGQEQAYIILHEQYHIRRYDHIVKALAFMALCLHWFNPLVWAAFILSSRDMEMSCDEAVLRKMGSQIRADYAASLLTLSTGRRIIAGMPLAFGEGDAKGRIRNLARWKKPGIWVILIALILCAVLAFCLLTDPVTVKKSEAGVSYYYGTIVERGMRVIQEGDQEGRGYISIAGDDGQDYMFWEAEGYTDIPEVTVGDHVMVRAWLEGPGDLAVTSRVIETANTWAWDLEEAIMNSILDINHSERFAGMLPCASFVQLAEERSADIITVYGLALHQVYRAEGNTLIEESGSHIPVALTFRVSETGQYILTEYWKPRDGGYYTDDIRAKFPPFVWPDTQAHITAQIQNCYIQAVEHFGIATAPVVSSLLDSICEYAQYDDRPEVLITHAYIEFRELTYYGRYTLQYCFSEFLKGGQSGPRAEIMAAACQDIMEGWGENSLPNGLTGQAWFDAFAESARSLAQRRDRKDLEADHPASVILLDLINGIS